MDYDMILITLSPVRNKTYQRAMLSTATGKPDG